MHCIFREKTMGDLQVPPQRIDKGKLNLDTKPVSLYSDSPGRGSSVGRAEA